MTRGAIGGAHQVGRREHANDLAPISPGNLHSIVGLPTAPFHIEPVRRIKAGLAGVPPIPKIRARLPPLFAVELHYNGNLILRGQAQKFIQLRAHLRRWIPQVRKHCPDAHMNRRVGCRRKFLGDPFEHFRRRGRGNIKDNEFIRDAPDIRRHDGVEHLAPLRRVGGAETFVNFFLRLRLAIRRPVAPQPQPQAALTIIVHMPMQNKRLNTGHRLNFFVGVAISGRLNPLAVRPVRSMESLFTQNHATRLPAIEQFGLSKVGREHF